MPLNAINVSTKNSVWIREEISYFGPSLKCKPKKGKDVI